MGDDDSMGGVDPRADPDELQTQTLCRAHRILVQKKNRGAEQGDPMGPIYCALVLAQVVARTRDALQGA